jgi:predicted small metal-binding protein
MRDKMAKKYSFACKDIGMSCGFRTNAASENELMGKIAEHAKAAHNMASIDAATMSKVKAAVKTE